MGRYNKFGAVRVEINGIKFASKAEGRRYGELKLLERAKEISGLTPHPKFSLVVNGSVVGRYTPDFGYIENGKQVVNEIKGKKTQDYVLRHKLFCALFPDIRFVEIAAK